MTDITWITEIVCDYEDKKKKKLQKIIQNYTKSTNIT